MRKTLMFIAATCMLSASGLSLTAGQQPATTANPAPAAATAKPSADDTLRALRADLQGSRADIMAKNITLTADQAAKFWPLFDKYQKEQNVIMDEQLAGLQKFVDTYQTADDATALALITAHLERDTRMAALRTRWLGEFQKVLPTKIAARVMQIDRRLSLAHQMEFSMRIPLIH